MYGSDLNQQTNYVTEMKPLRFTGKARRLLEKEPHGQWLLINLAAKPESDTDSVAADRTRPWALRMQGKKTKPPLHKKPQTKDGVRRHGFCNVTHIGGFRVQGLRFRVWGLGFGV